MPECLMCLGDGLHDFRDDNAALAEQLTDDELAIVRTTSAWVQPIQVCMECEGTGVISQARHDELAEQARVAVTRALAAHGLIPQREGT